jgi:hypothetical protein
LKFAQIYSATSKLVISAATSPTVRAVRHPGYRKVAGVFLFLALAGCEGIEADQHRACSEYTERVKGIERCLEAGGCVMTVEGKLALEEQRHWREHFCT